ncbi:hypothetical protein ACOSQ3_008376 [Xanthoceras sorbifolium]
MILATFTKTFLDAMDPSKNSSFVKKYAAKCLLNLDTHSFRHILNFATHITLCTPGIFDNIVEYLVLQPHSFKPKGFMNAPWNLRTMELKKERTVIIVNTRKVYNETLPTSDPPVNRAKCPIQSNPNLFPNAPFSHQCEIRANEI